MKILELKEAEISDVEIFTIRGVKWVRQISTGNIHHYATGRPWIMNGYYPMVRTKRIFEKIMEAQNDAEWKETMKTINTAKKINE